MTATLILFTVLGWLSYWVMKVPSTIKCDSPINTVKQFLSEHWKSIFYSAIGVGLVCFGGDNLPIEVGKVDSPLSAFTVGGSLPSIMMNLSPFFKKSNGQ